MAGRSRGSGPVDTPALLPRSSGEEKSRPQFTPSGPWALFKKRSACFSLCLWLISSLGLGFLICTTECGHAELKGLPFGVNDTMSEKSFV